MIKIGKSYTVCENTNMSLCADISVDDRNFTVWFSVNAMQKEYLSTGVSDPFVIAALPIVLCENRVRHKIICEDPISARLCYQLENYLIPAFFPEERMIAERLIQGAIRTEPGRNRGAVGTAFSNDVDSLYTIMRHGKDCEYPLTHITVFDIEASSDGQTSADEFQEKCRQAEQFAQEQHLQCVFMNTNLRNVFHKEYGEVSSYYHAACVLALQGLFSVYIFSTEYEAASFKLEKGNAARYDLMTVGCVSTESLSFHLCGAEIRREEKIQLVSKWMETVSGIDLNIDKRVKRSIRGIGVPLSGGESGGEQSAKRKSTIRIGIPYIEKISEEVRLCSEIELHGQKRIMWFAVREAYGAYLVEDRVDAFVIALLTTAMRHALDIICAAPVTRRLLYQMNHYMIPTMASNMEEYHPVTVCAEPIDDVMECAGAVVTGWTGGVDSMFTYIQNVYSADPVHRLTHLLIANNGAIIGDTRKTFRRMVDKAENGFALEAGMHIIGVDTNLQEILDENFLAVTDMRHAAVIVALQKLFHIFLESAAYGFSEFSFHSENVALYEMALLKWFETDTTLFYSSGGSYLRWQKLQILSEIPLAQRYLHPCIYALRDNCCRCDKCIRTETVLYGLGTLDRFAAVFDVQQFEEDRDWYFAKVLVNKEQTHYKEAMELLRQRGVDLSNAQLMAESILQEDSLNQKKTIYRLLCRFKKWISENK